MHPEEINNQVNPESIEHDDRVMGGETDILDLNTLDGVRPNRSFPIHHDEEEHFPGVIAAKQTSSGVN